MKYYTKIITFNRLSIYNNSLKREKLVYGNDIYAKNEVFEIVDCEGGVELRRCQLCFCCLGNAYIVQ